MSWGGSNLIEPDKLRKQYITLLKQADKTALKTVTITYADSRTFHKIVDYIRLNQITYL